MSIFTEDIKIGIYARTGVLHTRAGDVATPTFMPDGTRGAVKGLTPEQVIGTGVDIVLANTYHLHLNPGEKVTKKLGGLHAFANRKGPMLTDSGGFQVFSLGSHTEASDSSHDCPIERQVAHDKLSPQSHSDNYSLSKKGITCTHPSHTQINNRKSHKPRITEDGVHFTDPKTGDKHFISPEISMQIQIDLGADMIVAFDHLIGLDNADPRDVKDAFDRTHRWLERCIVEFKRLTKDMKDRPLLFGVVQGGLDIELRKESLRIIQASDVDGVAIGGLSVGETREEMATVLEALAPLYDDKLPRFLLGVGTPEDLKIAVENGIDMLDCVLPTRNARHSSVWGTDGVKMTLTNEQYKEDSGPIEDGCDCYTCASGFSRAFLRHQFKSGDPIAGTLASIHNLRYMMRLCEKYRD